MSDKNNAENLIRLEDVCLRFDSDFAIHDLAFEVKRGEIFGFLGPSGAGKTTTIKLLTKQLHRESGVITLFGKPVEQIVREDYDRVGILSDTSALYERMSIEENLKFFAEIRGVGKGAVEQVLKQVGLYEQKKRPFKKCSRGMKQRAILASAVIHDPELLFLDEPTSGLDPAVTLEIHKLLRGLNEKGTTIFLTTHNMEEADKLCDRVGIINDGRMIACGTPQDLKLEFAREEMVILTKKRQSITVPKNEEGARKLLELMEADDCLTVHSQEPDLEEIFLQLTGREF